MSKIEIEEALKNTFISVIKYTNYFNQRTALFKKCIESLIETTKDTRCKIILIDNGGVEDEEYCLNLMHEEKIHAYLRFHNVGLVARNIGFDVGRELVPNAQFVVLSDDDILFKKGWLEECVAMLCTYPDRKIIATPMHSVCHMTSRLFKGKLPDGHVLNKRAGANCRVYRVKDMLELGRICRKKDTDPFHKNGVEYTNRFNKKGYLSALTFKPMVQDLQRRHAYSGLKGVVLTHLVKTYGNKKIKTGLSISFDLQKIAGKKVYGEISAYMLYQFKDLFLSCAACTRGALTLPCNLYKDRFELIDIDIDKKFDFIILDIVEQETLEELKEKIDYYITKLNSGGLLMCYMGLSRKKYFKSKFISKLGEGFQVYGGFIWKKVGD